MQKVLELGAKVSYQHPRTGKTVSGIIHGVQKIEDKKGRVTAVNYIIDTGKTVYEDVYKQDEHDIEFHKQMLKLMDKGVPFDAAQTQIAEKDDLPKRGKKMIEVGRFRQPQQLTVPADNVQAIK